MADNDYEIKVKKIMNDQGISWEEAVKILEESVLQTDAWKLWISSNRTRKKSKKAVKAKRKVA